MTDFKMVPVKEIHPDPNQPRKFHDPAALAELTQSVKEKGVLQPILIRPNEKGFVLVCGERRFRASKEAGLTEIPAVVRILSDDEALEIQIIENLQRKDVHPMEEAVAFKSMIENKTRPYSIADIAGKVHKPETYISQRLSLNNLIPDFQKEFYAGKFLIGHAILFSRLGAEDQKTCYKECKEWGGKEYKSVSSAKDFINRSIIRNLSSAPFKKDDATLNPEMGPCTTCPFRSGSNPSLFADIKEDDRCFKSSCFTKKIEVNGIRKIESILIEEPEIKLLHDGHSKILPEILEKVKQFGVKILKNYDDFDTYSSNGSTTKGIWISGNEIGKIEKIRLAGKQVSGSKSSSSKKTNVEEEISGIRERTKRAAELDDEKVWRRLHDEVIQDKALIHGKALSSIDTAAVLWSMYNKVGYSKDDEIEKLFGTADRKKLAQRMLSASAPQINQAFRIFINTTLDSAVGSHTANPGHGLLKMVAEQYHKEKISAIELEQKEKRIKREQRAQERIKALQAQKKAAPVKKATVKKPAVKSKTKKTSKKSK